MSNAALFEERTDVRVGRVDGYNSIADPFQISDRSAIHWRAHFGMTQDPSMRYQSVSAAKRKKALSDIDEYATYGDGWDGAGTLGPLPETIWHAKRFVYALPSALQDVDIALNLNGTISFEWESLRVSAELEVGRSTFASSIVEPGVARRYLNGPAESLPVSWFAEIAAALGSSLPSVRLGIWTNGVW